MIARRLAPLVAAVTVALLAPASASAIQVNKDFKPQNEFKLHPWIELKLGPVDMSINKFVLYLFLAAAATCGTMLYIGNRMQAKPNRIQTLVEAAYDLTSNTITRGNMDIRMASKWFAFVATLFFFIWFSNMIGFIPLPVNTEHPIHILGFDVPAFALYSATANFSMPLILTVVVWIAYQIEGIRAKGPINYFRGWVPSGVSGPIVLLVAPIEVISQLVRLVSLSARLFANMLAGHLLILLMTGGMVVLIGLIGVIALPVGIAFYVFEVVLIASLQAFIFALLSSIYLGEAVAEEH